MRYEGAMKNTIMQGNVEGERCRGRPKRVFADDINDWTGEDMTTKVKRAVGRRRWKEDAQSWVHQRPHKLRLS